MTVDSNTNSANSLADVSSRVTWAVCIRRMSFAFVVVVGGVAILDGITESAEERESRIADTKYEQRVRHLEEKLAGRPFVVVEERPFVIVSDLSKKDVRRWGTTVRWAVERLEKQYFERPPTQIVDVWLFKNAESYQTHVEEFFGKKPTTPYGYYSPQHHSLVMDISTGGGTLVHEIVHPYIETNFPRCPSWFNEGLASLYEQSSEGRDGAIRGNVNWRLSGLQKAIRNDSTISFKELCHTSSNEFYGDRSGAKYAQARYLCYYLQEQGKLEKYYHEFHKAIAQDTSGYKTLVKILDNPDMEEFQKGWESFVLSLRAGGE